MERLQDIDATARPEDLHSDAVLRETSHAALRASKRLRSRFSHPGDEVMEEDFRLRLFNELTRRGIPSEQILSEWSLRGVPKVDLILENEQGDTAIEIETISALASEPPYLRNEERINELAHVGEKLQKIKDVKRRVVVAPYIGRPRILPPVDKVEEELKGILGPGVDAMFVGIAD